MTSPDSRVNFEISINVVCLYRTDVVFSYTCNIQAMIEKASLDGVTKH